MAASLAVLLTGCAAKVLVSNPRNVVVDAGYLTTAQPIADAECAKHKRIARITTATRKNNDPWTFECVE